ncbi:MAG TPA: hypothetical protein VMF90_03130 [Rhizobiaceae bacterium]|nr:hypothetical protein [Rhizobiaceae bacterium]
MADPIGYAYNSFTKRKDEGSIDWANLKLMLLNNDATFDATHTTLEGPAGTSNVNEAFGNGWTEGGEAVVVAFTTVDTNDSMGDTADIIVTATAGPIPSAGAAYKAVLYDDTHVSKAPLIFYDLGGAQTANEGAVFRIIINTLGLFRTLYTLPS